MLIREQFPMNIKSERKSKYPCSMGQLIGTRRLQCLGNVTLIAYQQYI